MQRLGLILFGITFFLSLVGIFILYETSSYTALLNIGDKYYFVKYQIIWVILGVILSLVVSRINYKALYAFALPILLISMSLLVVVFLPGIGLELKGANRWINLGFFVIQPSELLKISLSIYLAAWLSHEEKGRLPAFMMLFLICVALVAMEPDLGTALIIAGTSLVVYFLSGSAIRDMVIILVVLIVGAFLLIKLEPYRVARLTAFQNFNKGDYSSTSYHVKQILVSLGSGGLGGVGFGNSTQKYAYLPEGTTDSIFALYAEEAGFIGSVFLILTYFIQLFIGFLIAARVSDKFGKLLAAGIITFIGIQTFVNLGSQAVLIPLTGVPLPYISYGGSSMIINYISLGVLLSIAKTIDPKKEVKMKRGK